ncbi:MAG: hypothetical protein AVDCRST_MAG86-1617, partial [uncultured Truepera sp.]
ATRATPDESGLTSRAKPVWTGSATIKVRVPGTRSKTASAARGSAAAA